ncbi:MAG: hypothetical protein AAFX01_00980 [Cyanobacteria bacterium J06638_28]
MQHSIRQSEILSVPPLRRWRQRWAQGVTLMILVNLLLVVFNLTYIPLRQIYLRYLPSLVRIYDPIKGIEPHFVTQNYLAEIETLRSQVAEEGLTSSNVQSTLASLQQQSITLIRENPFLDANQVTTFAQLKQRMRQFTGAASAQTALVQFWQMDYLQESGWRQADAFLSSQIEPLLKQTYFRETLPTGQYVDRFWRIDILFVLFFGSEILVRTFVLSREQPGTNWGDALARRWYELPLVLPFWRWLRLLPAAVRLHRTQLFKTGRLVDQITREPAAYLSDRAAKYLIVQLINQAQVSVREGTILNAFTTKSHQTQIGDDKKLDQITDRIVQLIVLRVMPTVKPDLEVLLRHSLHQALMSGQIYDGLLQIPGLDVLPAEALDGVADYLSQTTCDVLANAYTDEEGKVRLDQLSRSFRHALGQELQNGANSKELQVLLSDLLEEFKLNYIQRSQTHDPEMTLQEVDNLHQSIESRPLL